MSATHPPASHRIDWATLPAIGTLLAVPTFGTLLLMYGAARGPCGAADCPDTPAPLLVVLMVLNLLVPVALWAWPRHRAYDAARRAAFAAAMLLVVASVYGPALL
ncbi:hypothetical protein [Murinocardiopsis flavida]|nr:hypothetical protein [Murinocardiopsis flavida]